ncbi:U-box domain-containing protein 17-like [Primulina tabacum]|uniref:U-box domain-containing protein 17-like n=1 Tax=Primulina tabacum TaxID=48773 RepID=UPI003F598ED7
MEIVKRRAVKSLVTKMSSVLEQTRIKSIYELRLLMKNDPDSRLIIDEANAIPLIAKSLYSPVKILQENATATLLNLSISCKKFIMSSHGVLDALSHTLSNPASLFSAQCAAATIFSLDIIFVLVEIVRNHGSAARSIKDALRALFGMALYQLNQAQMVELGPVQALFSSIVKDGRVELIEDATAVTAQVAGCEESWEAFKKDSSVSILMDLLDNSTGSSHQTKENAVYTMLNLVQCGREKVVSELKGKIEARVIEEIHDVVENDSEKGEAKALALLKIFDFKDGLSESLSSHSS